MVFLDKISPELRKDKRLSTLIDDFNGLHHDFDSAAIDLSILSQCHANINTYGKFQQLS